jgi:hypothetical protein
MRDSDRTKIGGPESAFAVTQWSQINAFAGLDPEQQKAVLAELIAKYWKPVYCYLRRKGFDNEQAKDMTQGFFHEIVMGRHLIEHADSTKGRFRTLMLTTLDRYVISRHRYQTASKRCPPQKVSPMDDDPEVLSISAREMRPDQAFAYAWACELLQEVLAEVQRQCVHDGKDIHWQLFHLHVVEPLITGRKPSPLAELCRQLGVPTAVKAGNMIVTVRRQFQTAIKNRVRQYVVSEDEVDQEIRDLMEILSR